MKAKLRSEEYIRKTYPKSSKDALTTLFRVGPILTVKKSQDTYIARAGTWVWHLKIADFEWIGEPPEDHPDAEGTLPVEDAYEVGDGVGVKFDQDKPMMSLMPFDALYKTAEVFTYGAKKYSADNWAQGMRHRRMADAALRHLTAWLMGEDKDSCPECGSIAGTIEKDGKHICVDCGGVGGSGYDHLAHLNCCAQMLYAMQLRGVGTDDRFKLEKGSE